MHQLVWMKLLTRPMLRHAILGSTVRPSVQAVNGGCMCYNTGCPSGGATEAIPSGKGGSTAAVPTTAAAGELGPPLTRQQAAAASGLGQHASAAAAVTGPHASSYRERLSHARAHDKGTAEERAAATAEAKASGGDCAPRGSHCGATGISPE